GEVSDSDPQEVGVVPRLVEPLGEGAERLARVANGFIQQARERLADLETANGVLLRGFGKFLPFPSFEERFLLKAAAIAVYPMYRGIARLLGMEVLEVGEDLSSQLEVFGKNFEDYDFFYWHVKKTDSFGEDGNFAEKVRWIERVSGILPQILERGPEVFAITGDHSTPALYRAHSWHPVPFLLHSKHCRHHRVASFTERQCAMGDLGRLRACEVMPLLLANAGKLKKFGA
ncbi:MAG: phosphoglycerate mutase, partial [Planctomycetota bacterium]